MVDEVQVALAEFGPLRSEIDRRSKAQSDMLNLNITAIGTVGGLFFLSQQVVDQKVLLVLPVLSTSLGLLWLDHARAIGNLGRYIGEKIRPVVTQGSANSDLFANEQRDRLVGMPGFFMMLTLALPTLILFVAVPVTALAQVWKPVEAASLQAVWWAEVVYLAVYIAFWVQWFRDHASRIG